DEDHYGVNIPFRFGRADEPGVAGAMEAYRRYSGRDPADFFAVGDTGVIVERIAAFIAAGAFKFVLRPVATGDDEIMAQTRHLIEAVLPAVAARWPHPPAR